MCVNKNLPGRTIKQYYIDNYEKISEHKNFKNNCKCGGKYTNTNKCQHYNTIIHNNYVNETKNI